MQKNVIQGHTSMEPCTVKARTVRSGAARWTSTEARQ